MSNTINAVVGMRKYQCHKEVWALKIKAIHPIWGQNSAVTGDLLIIPEDCSKKAKKMGLAQIAVDRKYAQRYKPQVGGYLVVYRDGGKSFSPSQTFEDAYKRV